MSITKPKALDRLSLQMLQNARDEACYVSGDHPNEILHYALDLVITHRIGGSEKLLIQAEHYLFEALKREAEEAHRQAEAKGNGN